MLSAKLAGPLARLEALVVVVIPTVPPPVIAPERVIGPLESMVSPELVLLRVMGLASAVPGEPVPAGPGRKRSVAKRLVASDTKIGTEYESSPKLNARIGSPAEPALPRFSR